MTGIARIGFEADILEDHESEITRMKLRCERVGIYLLQNAIPPQPHSFPVGNMVDLVVTGISPRWGELIVWTMADAKRVAVIRFIVYVVGYQEDWVPITKG